MLDYVTSVVNHFVLVNMVVGLVLIETYAKYAHLWKIGLIPIFSRWCFYFTRIFNAIHSFAYASEYT